MPGAALNFSVQIHKFLVKALCQRRAEGGFSAARHPDDRDIRQLVPQLAADRRDDGCRVQLSAGKVLRGKHSLRHQHLKAARRGHAAVLGPQQKLGAEGIVHHIQHGLQRGERFRVDKALPHVREHAAGRRVDDDLHVRAVHGLAVQQGIALAGAAGGQNLLSPAVAADRRDRRVRTARTQDQHGLARKIYAVGPSQIGKARVVGVIPIQFPVTVHNRVHRADGLRLRVNDVAVGDDKLLVGDRHVDGRKGALFHKGAGLGLGGQGQQLIGVICNFFMDDFGVAVAQLAADQSVQRLLHSSSLPVFTLWGIRASGPACRSARSEGPAVRTPSGCSARRRRGARCRGHGGP